VRYQYHLEVATSPLSSTIINEKAKAGWRLFDIITHIHDKPYYYFYFERPDPEAIMERHARRERKKQERREMMMRSR
jgi:transposase